MLVISNRENIFYCAFISFDMREVVREAGFVWSIKDKEWVSDNPKPAYRLITFCTPDTQKLVINKLGLEPIDFDFKKLRRPVGKTPYLHQVDACKWVLTRKHSYLAMEAGTGKTIVSILCMNADPGPTIIICPAFLKYTWKKEIEAWYVKRNKIQIIHHTRTKLNPNCDIFIMPSSLMHVLPLREAFFDSGINFKWVFVDEAHYYKNSESKRTKSLFGGKIHANHRYHQWKSFHTITERMVCLSGTPMPNRPMELFAVTRRLAPHAIDFGDAHDFGLKYCGGRETEFGWDYKGGTNLEELNKKLTQDFMYVKKLADCVDLPDKLIKFIYLNDNRGEREKSSEMKLLRELDLSSLAPGLIESDTPEGDSNSEESEAVKRIKVLALMAKLRKQVGLKKIDQASTIINGMCSEGEPLLVFAWHKEVIHTLAEKLKKINLGVITGETPHPARQKLVDEFQQGEKQLLICNIQAAGVGITLTKSNRVLFVEPSWVPADNDQAISRVHRIGQTKPVQANFLIYEDSIDHKVLNAHMRKSKTIEKVIR